MLSRPALYWALAFSLTAVTLAAAEARVTSSDLGFYLYAAGRLLDGAVLYRDVVEINPPLIIWLNLPAVLVARSTGISEVLAYRLTVTVVLAASILLCERILRSTARDAERIRPFLLVLWFVLFPFAWIDFGQREHLLLGLFLPYLTLAAAELRGRAPGPSQRLAAGLLAGVGLSLKPHFALLWVAIEGYRGWQLRSRRLHIPLEVAGIIGFIALYGVLVLATTDYVAIVSVLGPAYSKYMNVAHVDALLLTQAAPLVLYALAAYAALRRSADWMLPGALLATAIVAAYAAAALQHKGFRYH